MHLSKELVTIDCEVPIEFHLEEFSRTEMDFDDLKDAFQKLEMHSLISQMKSLVKSVCESMGDKYASEDAINLVLATGIVESRYEYIRQLGDGPARSFWQVEPATCVDNLAHYLKHRPKLMKRCAEASVVDLKHWQDFEEKKWEEILEKNIAAGIVHCRLKYWRVPKKMPNSIEGQADYWKKYYNTEGGKGDPEHFIEACKKYLR